MMAAAMKMTMLRLMAIASCVPLGHSFLPAPKRPFLASPHCSTTTTTKSSWRLESSTVSLDNTTTTTMPRLHDSHLQELSSRGYVVIPNFLPTDLQAALREDIATLRKSNNFKVAKIGQDSTNTLNQDIRVAETCFLGPSKLKHVPSQARTRLYNVLDQVRKDLPGPLDPNLTELLYVFYPQGGFYRRHRDAIPGSASVLRSFSFLLYLNQDWTLGDGGQLLLHRDSGGDELPEGEEPNFITVHPQGGTLVLFQSDLVPHEVLDTNAERLAVVGWYNRPVSAADISSLGDNSMQPMLLLGLSAALVTVGLVTLLT